MKYKSEERINPEDGLIPKYLSEDEVQMLERYKELSNNFRWYILSTIGLCIEYQEKNY